MLLYLFIHYLSLHKFLIIQWLIVVFLLNIWTASWEADYAMQIQNTSSARPCEALMLKTGNSLKKRRWKTYLWTQTRIHCTWQRKPAILSSINKHRKEGNSSCSWSKSWAMFYWDNAGPWFIWPLHAGTAASVCLSVWKGPVLSLVRFG